MKGLKRLIVMVTVLSILLVMFAGCTSEATVSDDGESGEKTENTVDNDTSGEVTEASEDEIYGLVTFLKGSEFFNWVYAGFKDAAETVGVKAEYLGPAEWDAAGEAEAIDQLLARDPSGIAVAAGDADTLVAPINNAIAAGVPVVTFDSDSPESDRLLYVGTDAYTSGYVAGKAVGETLGDDARVGISLIPGLEAIEGRIQGFTDGMQEVAPGAQIVAEVNDEGDLIKAEEVITAMLQAHPEVNVIFCAHGNPVTGAVASVKNVGRDDVHVIGWAIGIASLELLKSGDIDMLIAQRPYLEGIMCFYALYSAAHPTQYASIYDDVFGCIPSDDINTGAYILFADDPEVDALMINPDID